MAAGIINEMKNKCRDGQAQMYRKPLVRMADESSTMFVFEWSFKVFLL